MNLRHDAIIVETLTSKDTGRVLERKETPALEFVSTMEFLWGFMYNGLTMSGGVLWRDPMTGELFPKGLSYKLDTKTPEMQLAEGQFCECAECERNYNNA